MSANTLKGASDEALIAEVLRRRGKEAPGFLEQARVALAENKVRPGVADVLAGDMVTPFLVADPLEAAQKRELVPDSPDAIALFAKLEARFGNTPAHYNVPAFLGLREGIRFAEVRTALTAHPELLWRLNWMEETGGQPDVWGKEDGLFIFRCSSAESPEGRRNCVYTKKAADELRAEGKQFNGSVEKTVEDTGVHVVSADAWKTMNETAGDGKGMGFTRDTIDWVDSSDIAHTGFARNARRFNDLLDVYPGGARGRDPGWGWRASLRVYWLCTGKSFHRFQPAPQHSSRFLQFRLQLKHFCFTDQFQFKKQSQFQRCRLQLGTGLDQVTGFQRFGRILRHDQM